MAIELWQGGASGGTTVFSTALNWRSSDTPDTGDGFRIPASAAYAILGEDYTSALLVSGFIESGYDYDIATELLPLSLDCDAFTSYGAGTIHLSITNSASCHIGKCGAAASVGAFGTNLTGATNTLLMVNLESNMDLGVAALAGQTAGFTTITITGAGNVTIGSGVTCTTCNSGGGVVECSCALTNLTVNGGATHTQKAGAITTITQSDGTFYAEGNGTITTYNLRGGSLDLSKNTAGLTITTLAISGPATINDPYGRLTVTNPTQLVGDCSLDDVAWTRPGNFTIAFGSI